MNQDTLNTLLLITNSGGKKIDENLISSVENWEELGRLAVETHLAPIVHKAIEDFDAVPKPSQNFLSNARNQVLIRNIRLYDAFKWLLKELNARSIPIIPLKGIYAAEKIYGDISLRHLSDIDILVHTKHASVICNLMKEAGWQVKEATAHSDMVEQELEAAHPFSFLKNGMVIELHTHLYNRKNGAQISSEDLWEYAHEEPFLGGTIQQFEKEFLLQHWCLHLHKHLVGREVKMISFLDIHLLLEQQHDFDWKRFESLCKQYKCTQESLSVLWLCSRYWGIQLPEKYTFPDKELEAKFWGFLSQETRTPERQAEFQLSSVLRRMGKLNGNRQKLIFLFRFVFPKQGFMRNRYNVAPHQSLALWYIYRPFGLFQKLLVAASSKLSR
ncbi:MAG: nucleotidyltransferase domain-containing protein [Flavobacteriales bacterium]